MSRVNALVLLLVVGGIGGVVGCGASAPAGTGGGTPSTVASTPPTPGTWTPGTWTAALLTPQAGDHLTTLQRARIDQMEAPLSGAWQVYTAQGEEARTALLGSLGEGILPAPAIEALVTAERGLRDVGVAPLLRILRLVDGGGRAAVSGATWRAPVPAIAGPAALRVQAAERTLEATLSDAGIPVTPARTALVAEDKARVETVGAALRAWRISVLSLDLTREAAPTERLTTAWDALSITLDADLRARLGLAPRVVASVPRPQRGALLEHTGFLAWAGLDRPSPGALGAAPGSPGKAPR